jgi:hypothetical protein
MKLAAATFLLIGGVGLLVIAWREHAPQQQLPLGQASTLENVARANMLYAPCPLTPQNVPIPKEDRA